MAVGDELGFSEDIYHVLIGRYVAAVEVLGKRIIMKDQHIAKLESEQAKSNVEQVKGDDATK